MTTLKFIYFYINSSIRLIHPAMMTSFVRRFHIFRTTPTERSQSYKERRLLGYSQTQMFDIASDVSRYSEFVPWCNDSVILKTDDTGALLVRLGVGFPPISESYTSRVTLVHPKQVKSVALYGQMFNRLINEWNFMPGLPGNSKSCTIEFSVEFEFRSIFYAKIAGLFFDQVVMMMVNAFIQRAQMLHGPASLPSQKPQILTYVKGM